MLQCRPPVKHTAYLLVRLDVTGAIPVVKHVDIYSSKSPTTMSGECFAEIMSEEGDSFQAAHDLILDRVRRNPWHAWILPFIEPGYDAHMKRYDLWKYADMVRCFVGATIHG